eukprot:gene17925-biopygen4725
MFPADSGSSTAIAAGRLRVASQPAAQQGGQLPSIAWLAANDAAASDAVMRCGNRVTRMPWQRGGGRGAGCGGEARHSRDASGQEALGSYMPRRPAPPTGAEPLSQSASGLAQGTLEQLVAHSRGAGRSWLRRGWGRAGRAHSTAVASHMPVRRPA